jgi:hypothetical protein
VAAAPRFRNAYQTPWAGEPSGQGHHGWGGEILRHRLVRPSIAEHGSAGGGCAVATGAVRPVAGPLLCAATAGPLHGPGHDDRSHRERPSDGPKFHRGGIGVLRRQPPLCSDPLALRSPSRLSRMFVQPPCAVPVCVPDGPPPLGPRTNVQNDSIVLNRAAVQRGLGMSLAYHTSRPGGGPVRPRAPPAVRSPRPVQPLCGPAALCVGVCVRVRVRVCVR